MVREKERDAHFPCHMLNLSSLVPGAVLALILEKKSVLYDDAQTTNHPNPKSGNKRLASPNACLLLTVLVPHCHFPLLNRTPTSLYRKHAPKAILHLRHTIQRYLHVPYDLFIYRRTRWALIRHLR
jgi:hypothetical protein